MTDQTIESATPDAVDNGDAPLVGMYAGFEAYRTQSVEEIVEALQTGLVSLDTNVLLDLYRYDDEARDGLLTVLAAIGDRLFVPHQVMSEFWRNRDGAVKDRSVTVRDAIDELEGLGDKTRAAIGRWVNRMGISSDVRDVLVGGIDEGLRTVIETVEASAGDDNASVALDTATDPVLAGLDAILKGAVGRPYAEEAHGAAVVEGLRRVEHQLPPGFKDADKPGEDSAGDYLVWSQTLAEARRRALDSLVFVTGDSKEDDWFRKVGNNLRGPRPELFDEAQLDAGATLYMIRPATLLYHAEGAFALTIDGDAIDRVQRSGARQFDGWTSANVHILLERLGDAGPAQRSAVMAAMEDGGYVRRDAVYKLAGYEADRTLRGFTRPAKRIMRAMQDEGLLADSVEEPLTTVYDPSESYVSAAGFRVPDEFLDVSLVEHRQAQPQDGNDQALHGDPT